MYNKSGEEYVSPQIEILTVKVEYTHISESGTEMNRIDPVLENQFDEIL
ncbi:MAG: hypothetical protein K2J31_02815 [Alistipes sp.]|nr:hypothetical protein [Alistipes sp.]MDE6861663.1 hypothetical protein [Alistipes sp.]